MTRAAVVALGAVAIAATAVVLVAVFPGSGSAGDGRARARADALCTAAHAQLASLPSLDGQDAIARSGPRVVAVTLDTARRLLAIDAPNERAEAIRRYVRHLVRQAELTTRLGREAAAGDLAGAASLIDALRANSRRGQRIGREVAPGCSGSTRPRPENEGQAV